MSVRLWVKSAGSGATEAWRLLEGRAKMSTRSSIAVLGLFKGGGSVDVEGPAGAAAAPPAGAAGGSCIGGAVCCTWFW